MSKISAVFFDIGGTLGAVTPPNGGSGYVLHPFRDAATVLAGLSLLDLRLGVITNVPSDLDQQKIVSLLAAASLARFLDPVGIITSTEAPKPKPSVEIYVYAASALGVTTEQCLYVGDDPAEVEGARAAGMQAILRV